MLLDTLAHATLSKNLELYAVIVEEAKYKN